jgi:hypothetical protein
VTLKFKPSELAHAAADGVTQATRVDPYYGKRFSLKNDFYTYNFLVLNSLKWFPEKS